MIKKQAFTMLELSVVLIIIATLMIFVTLGNNLVKVTDLANARYLTKTSPVKDIEGLVAWYETTLPESLKMEETIDGSKISTWYDINPNLAAEQKNNLTKIQNNSTKFVKNGINKLPSIFFQGQSEQRMILDSFSQGSLSQRSIFIVTKPFLASGGSIIASSNDSDTTESLVYFESSNSIKLRAAPYDTIAVTYSPTNILVNNDYILNINFNKAKSRIYINNATEKVGGVDKDPGDNDMHGISLGSKANNKTFYKGLISELIIFNRPLKEIERKSVMKYLSKKYDIKVANL